MSRKSLLVSLACVVFILTVLGTAAYLLLTHAPTFYQEAAVPPGPARVRDSSAFFEQVHDFLVNDISYQSAWSATFSDRQVNSWFAEEFAHANLASLWPKGVEEPRVAFRGDRVLLGFRYGRGALSTVVSLEARLWLPRREPGVVVEVLSFRAGAVPLAIKVLQDEVTERARRQNVKVLWYRHNGHPAAVVRFQADKREPTVQLRTLELRDGLLAVAGRSLDPEFRPPPAAVPTRPLPKPPAN
jgi:hypothetical protein